MKFHLVIVGACVRSAQFIPKALPLQHIIRTFSLTSFALHPKQFWTCFWRHCLLFLQFYPLHCIRRSVFTPSKIRIPNIRNNWWHFVIGMFYKKTNKNRDETNKKAVAVAITSKKSNLQKDQNKWLAKIGFFASILRSFILEATQSI